MLPATPIVYDIMIDWYQTLDYEAALKLYRYSVHLTVSTVQWNTFLETGKRRERKVNYLFQVVRGPDGHNSPRDIPESVSDKYMSLGFKMTAVHFTSLMNAYFNETTNFYGFSEEAVRSYGINGSGLLNFSDANVLEQMIKIYRRGKSPLYCINAAATVLVSRDSHTCNNYCVNAAVKE